jgi:probable phosphoglycerate mutase
VWLFRHGEVPQVTPRRFVGQSDAPLSDEGRRQAAFWAAALDRIPFSLALCSDLARCRETARIMFRDRDIPCGADQRLREIALGEWEGLTVAQVRERFPGQYEARGADLAGFRPTGGESFYDVQVRAGLALDACLEAARATPCAADGEDVVEAAVVAHGGVNRALLCGLLGMPLAHLFRLGQDYGCLNLLEFFGGSPVAAAVNIRPESPFPRWP